MFHISQSSLRMNFQPCVDWPQLPTGWNLGECHSVDVDASGTVWMLSSGPHPVVSVRTDGSFISEFREVNGVTPHGLRVAPDNSVWIVDRAEGGSVVRYDTSGRITLVLSHKTWKWGGATSVCFDDCNVYVADGYENSRIVKLSHEGQPLTEWGTHGSGPGQFRLVHDVCADSARHRICVVDRGNSRVQLFDRDGVFLCTWDLEEPVWSIRYFEPEDCFYCASNHCIVKLDPSGRKIGSFGEYGHSLGKFDRAHSLALDSRDASLYVAEVRNWRVQKFVRT